MPFFNRSSVIRLRINSSSEGTAWIRRYWIGCGPAVCRPWCQVGSAQQAPDGVYPATLQQKRDHWKRGLPWELYQEKLLHGGSGQLPGGSLWRCAESAIRDNAVCQICTRERCSGSFDSSRHSQYNLSDVIHQGRRVRNRWLYWISYLSQKSVVWELFIRFCWVEHRAKDFQFITPFILSAKKNF